MYEVRADAPLKYRDILFFLATEVGNHERSIREEMVSDDEEEDSVQAAPLVVNPLVMDLRTGGV